MLNFENPHSIGSMYIWINLTTYIFIFARLSTIMKTYFQYIQMHPYLNKTYMWILHYKLIDILKPHMDVENMHFGFTLKMKHSRNTEIDCQNLSFFPSHKYMFYHKIEMKRAHFSLGYTVPKTWYWKQFAAVKIYIIDVSTPVKAPGCT